MVIKNPIRYVRLSYIEDGRFSLSRFNRVPTKIGQYREIQNWTNYGNPKFKSSCKRTQRRLSRVWKKNLCHAKSRNNLIFPLRSYYTSSIKIILFYSNIYRYLCNCTIPNMSISSSNYYL